MRTVEDIEALLKIMGGGVSIVKGNDEWFLNHGPMTKYPSRSTSGPVKKGSPKIVQLNAAFDRYIAKLDGTADVVITVPKDPDV